MYQRKAKKKRALTIPQEQQQTAQDKLFELSYFYQQKYNDQSKHLQQSKQPLVIPRPNRQKPGFRVARHFQRSRMTSDKVYKQSIPIYFKEKPIALSVSPKRQVIQNTISSNKVFVGAKKTIQHRQSSENSLKILKKTFFKLPTQPITSKQQKSSREISKQIDLISFFKNQTFHRTANFRTIHISRKTLKKYNFNDKANTSLLHNHTKDVSIYI